MGIRIRFSTGAMVALAAMLTAQIAVASNPSPRGGLAEFCQSGAASARGGASVVSPANDIALSQTVFNTDYVSAGVGGLRNVGSGDITLAGVSGTVTKALLYWNGPTNSTDPSANASITVNGNGFVGTNIGFTNDNCWSFANTQAYVVDVTALVQGTGNGVYAITGLGADLASVVDGKNSNGASLIVFFDDGNATNNRDVVVFHGNDSNMPNIFDADGWNVSLSGINYAAGTANLQLHVADGQDLPDGGGDEAALVLNGSDLVPQGPIFSGNTVPSANNGPDSNGSLWDIRTFDVTSYMVVGPNTLTMTMGQFSDCVGLVVAIIDLPAGAAPTDCDSICGWVYDTDCFQKTGCGVDGAHVELWSSYPDGVILDSTLTSGGAFCFYKRPGQIYSIRIWKKGYCTQVVEDWTCEDGSLNVFLQPLDFVPLPNWPYFTDYFSTAATFQGYPIQPGDVIYATDPSGVICGIVWVTQEGVYLIHVLGDDPETVADEGAELGDQITLWLNCECPVVAPDTWVNFGDFQFDAAWDCRPTGLCCILCKGWNMWSYNILQPSYARQDVLASIDLNYSAVRSGLCDAGSISWFEGRPLNDLTTVTPWYGYDLLMKQDDTVCIEGQLVDPTTPIYLCAGWNYIPYLPMEMDNLGHALQSLSGNYSHIFTMYCGLGVVSWFEGRPVNDLTCMETCHGYWIKMKTDDTLIYPSMRYDCNPVEAKLSASSASGRVTASPMVADFWSAGGSGLNIGDQLTVRGTSGQMVGECTVGAGGAFLMHVYGDVPTTSEMEGVQHGESLTFEVNGVAASVSGQTHWYDRDNNEITVTPTSGSPVPTEYALLQNYPNPFNAGTVMPFVLKNTSTWTLTVYNVMGQEVHSFEGNDGAGTVRVSWNGTDRNGSTVPSGIYFYRVSTPEWTASKKMTLLK